MTKQEKINIVDELVEKFSSSDFFYVTDSSNLSVEDINSVRRKCFENNIELRVIKNTLVQKALERVEGERNFEKLYPVLAGPTSVMFCDKANVPAKVIKELRKSFSKPILKAAYIDTAVYIGDDQVGALADLKSKEQLIGDVILLLQSPLKNVIGALKSSGSPIAGLVKTLQERAQ